MGIVGINIRCDVTVNADLHILGKLYPRFTQEGATANYGNVTQGIVCMVLLESDG
jgi:hypothetical protein